MADLFFSIVLTISIHAFRAAQASPCVALLGYFVAQLSYLATQTRNVSIDNIISAP